MIDMSTPLAERLTPLVADGSALADKVYDIIGEAIATGRLAPEERVNDKEVAAALGISRTPVREALQRLTWIGLVEMAPSRYTRVTPVTETAVDSTLEYLGMQSGVALRLAMLRMDAAETEQAVALLDAVITASDADDVDALFPASQAFVDYLVARSGNVVLSRVMKEADLLMTRNLRGVRHRSESAEHRTRALRRLRAAILEGDADAAERWLRVQHGIAVDKVH